MKNQDFIIHSEYIELIKLLKATSVADSGATAKQIVNDGLAKVNGLVEYRLRCKLYPDFVVEVLGNKIRVVEDI